MKCRSGRSTSILCRSHPYELANAWSSWNVVFRNRAGAIVNFREQRQLREEQLMADITILPGLQADYSKSQQSHR